jgi:hypothetical protein
MELLTLSQHSVLVGLYKDVENCETIRQSLLKGELVYALIDAKVLLAPIQLFLAIHKALDAMDRQKLVTKNVHAEIVYCLSPSKNVSITRGPAGLRLHLKEKGARAKNPMFCSVPYT